MTGLRCVLVAVLGVVSLPGVAHAWFPIDFGCGIATVPGGTVEWHLESRYILDTIPEPRLAEMVSEAFDEWARPGCSSVSATQAPTRTGAAPEPDGAVAFIHVGWPMDPNVMAFATPEPAEDDACSIVRGSVVVNAEHYTWTDGGANDLLPTLTHEVGHWWGLGHSSLMAATMAPCIEGSDAATLSCDDTEGICELYPTGDTSCEAGGGQYCPCGTTCREGACVSGDSAPTGPGRQSASHDDCGGWEGDGGGGGDSSGGGSTSGGGEDPTPSPGPVGGGGVFDTPGGAGGETPTPSLSFGVECSSAGTGRVSPLMLLALSGATRVRRGRPRTGSSE